MQCMDCGADLPPEPGVQLCSECGAENLVRATTTLNRGTRRGVRACLRKGPGFLWGLAFAVLVGLANWGIIVWGSLDMGLMLYVGLPMSVGALYGYTVSVRGALMTGAVAVAITLSMILLGVVLGFTGLFCALVLAAVFVAPILLGLVLGALFRGFLGARVAPAIILAVFPAFGAAIETALCDEPTRMEVSTERRVGASAALVWGHIVFFEEGEAEVPWIFRWGLPRPLRAEGSKAAIGDESVCIYSSGRLRKRITERIEERRLAFVVTEQDLHFERDIRLLGGSIEVFPEPGGICRLRLTTHYEGLTSPDGLWRPIEAWCLHRLHDYVIDEISRRAAEASSVASR